MICMATYSLANCSDGIILMTLHSLQGMSLLIIRIIQPSRDDDDALVVDVELLILLLPLHVSVQMDDGVVPAYSAETDRQISR